MCSIESCVVLSICIDVARQRSIRPSLQVIGDGVLEGLFAGGCLCIMSPTLLLLRLSLVRRRVCPASVSAPATSSNLLNAPLVAGENMTPYRPIPSSPAPVMIA